MSTGTHTPEPGSQPAAAPAHPASTAKPAKKLSAWGQVARYSAIGMTIPSHLVAGWLIGTLLDKLFSTDYLYIAFVLVGVVSGFVEMIRLASRDVD